MTDKPEVVAWLKVTHATEDNWDIVIADQHKKEANPEIGSRYTIPLIRLTDHEASRAADKARIAELVRALQRISAWGTGTKAINTFARAALSQQGKEGGV